MTSLKPLFLVLTGFVLASCLPPEPVPFCGTKDLSSYDLVLKFDDGREYAGKISLPDFSATSGDFCGYWSQRKFTGGSPHLYEGYKGESVRISLNPEIADAGLAIQFGRTRDWPSRGLLGRESFAGVIPIGIFEITDE